MIICKITEKQCFMAIFSIKHRNVKTLIYSDLKMCSSNRHHEGFRDGNYLIDSGFHFLKRRNHHTLRVW